nr:DUF1732 domain-containing protein [Parvularcula mediterranea]
MTGFGVAEGSSETLGWRWELRSVNGRGLDLKIKLPVGTDPLEPKIREAGRALGRGNAQISLKLDRSEALTGLVVDDEALAAAAAAISKVQLAVDCDKPRPEAILAMRGVLAPPTNDAALTEADLDTLEASFREGLDALLQARRTEGARIAAFLTERCEDMTNRVGSIRNDVAGARDQMAERLRTQLGELLAEHVSPDRIAQEAAMLAIKADVSEELDRLEVHLASFTELLAKGGTPGRRLEFLTQELMREASTLTAKLPTAALKNQGLDLKEMVDSLREQVLNLA